MFPAIQLILHHVTLLLKKYHWFQLNNTNLSAWLLRYLRTCSYTNLSPTSVYKAMAPHSSTLAWKIPWMEERGGLQSMGLLRVGHDWVASLSLFTLMHWRRKWQPTPVFLPGESQGQGACWAAVYGVPQSRTRLKWLSIVYTWCIWSNLHSHC